MFEKIHVTKELFRKLPVRLTLYEEELTTILEWRLDVSDMGEMVWERSSSSHGLLPRLELKISGVVFQTG